MGRTLLVAAALAALLGFAPGCFEEIADPTQGFVEVDTGGVAGAEVFVDGVSHGVATTVGPVDVGQHTVRVHRAGYEVVPAETEVDVRPARTARAAFALTLAFTGSAHVTATDELRGTEVTGAEILVDIGSGFTSTGVTTPGIVAGLPPGAVQFRLRKAGYTDTDALGADIVVAETADVGADLGPPRAVLAEMFTYVVCPNCPTASAKLESMRVAAPGRFHVIEWHIRNGLDLYDARWVTRQAYYGGASGWPATGFQGGANDSPVLIIGSQAAELAEYDARAAAAAAACENDCPLALVVDGTIGATSADVTVRVKWRGGSLPGTLMLRAVLIENGVIASGNQPYFDFVAREISEGTLSLPAAGSVSSTTVSLPVSPAWVHDELQVIAFVQSDATHEVLAVGALE